MVSKITIFEPHFDGAQFGPASLPGDDAAAESPVRDAGVASDSETSGRSVGRRLFLVGALAAGLFLGLRAVRRQMGRETEPVEIEKQESDAPTLTH